MALKFNPEQKVINELFARDVTYIIPEYQRPYAWDCLGKSDKTNQVNVMWDDLIEFYKSKNSNEYFLGSIVVIPNNSSIGQFEVIDGQQRLTTLTLLFAAIACFLKEQKLDFPVNTNLDIYLKNTLKQVNELIFNTILNDNHFIEEEKKVKIERSTAAGFDYDHVLKTVMECGKLTDINLSDATDEQKIVTARYFENKDFFISRLKDEFLSQPVFTEEKARELNLFINFLKNKVTVIRIQADNFEVAYQIFEILNNRGLQLSNKDLFRNFIIKEFSDLKNKNTEKYKDLIPNQKWLDLDAYQLDPEFISRYVESKKGSNQKSSAFNNLQNIYNKEFNDGLKEFKIELFFKDIQENLIIYTQIKESNFPNKQIKNRIDYLLASDNTPYIINLLMALLRYTNKEDEILDFLKIFERYILLLNVGSAKRFRSGIIYDVIKAFNRKDFDLAKTIIHLDLTQIAELKEYLARPIIDHDIAKLIIARYYWAIENQSPEDVVEQTLDYNRATLEHIIPQKPAEQTNWMKDFSSEFIKNWTYKLGNMTLLTNKMNQKNSNSDFSKKKEQYAKTKLALTRDLSKIEKISPTHIENRQTEILEVLYKDLEL